MSTNKCRLSQDAYAKVNDDYLKISRIKALLVHVYHRRYQLSGRPKLMQLHIGDRQVIAGF